MFEDNTDLIYSGTVSRSKYNLLEVNDEFLQALEQQGEIVIQNNPNQQTRFFGRSKSFHLANIKYLNTLLVDSQGCVLRQNNNYLKVQVREPNTHEIYDELRKKQVHYKQVLNKDIDQLVVQYGIELSAICETFKISPIELLNFAEKASYIYHQPSQSILVLSIKVFNEVFNKVNHYLTGSTIPFDSIEIQELYPLVFKNQQIPYIIYQTSCKFFMIPNQPQAKNPPTYTINVPCIIKYVLTEMGENKPQYLKQEFDNVFKEMFNVYVPLFVEKPQTFPEISDYFLYVKEVDEMVYYRKLMLPRSTKDLIVFMSKIKRKYNYEEIKGLMGHVFEDKSLQQAINKHFRKFGEQYELKAVVLA